MNEETIRTKALTFGRSHWKMVAAWAIAGASTLVNISMTLGHKQADTAALNVTVTSLVTEVREMRGEVGTLTRKQDVFETKLDNVHEDVRDFKDWKDRVTGVAETISVPKMGRRVRKP